MKLNAKIECDPILHSTIPNTKTGSRKILFDIYDDILIGLKNWAQNRSHHLTLFTESLRFWFIPTKESSSSSADLGTAHEKEQFETGKYEFF